MEKWENWRKWTAEDGTPRYEIENESGKFICDETGLLRSFTAAAQNTLDDYYYQWKREGLQHLVIPEGIARIGTDFFGEDRFLDTELFRDRVILGTIVFPKSLKALGSSAFSECLIMEMELPAQLQEINSGALMHCYIHTLRIPANMPVPDTMHREVPEGTQKLRFTGRQFKQTMIQRLVVPREYPYKVLMLETKIHQVRYLPESGGDKP